MLKNVIRLSLYASLTYALSSCKSGEAKQEPVSKDIFALADSMATADSTRVSSDSIQASVPDDPNFKTYPVAGYGDDSTADKNPAIVLTTGQFHEDEVSKDDSSRSWYGIFQNGNTFYLDTTRIATKRVQDPIDDDGTLNGWEVTTTHRDTSLLLFAGLKGLEKHNIKPVSINKKHIWPGESVTYTYNGITYTLYATGNKHKQQPDNEYDIVTSYRLFIKTTINGTERTQMLVASREFDDRMTEIIFAGDIDGDSIPDLIINTSYHYNVDIPTLYLSKPAGSNEVLKLMGWHLTVGC